MEILSKRLTEEDLSELVSTEGWPLKLLDYDQRKNLAHHILDKLKIINEGKEYRLELTTYVETKMLIIARAATPHEFEAELGKSHSLPSFHAFSLISQLISDCIVLGTVEINVQDTLSDLRILIKNELDPDELPQQFRFLYKGATCSLRQETFRRAWECFPVCYITPKIIETVEMGTETEDIAQKRLLQKVAPKKEDTGLKMIKGQRRVPGKCSKTSWIICYFLNNHPISILFLCREIQSRASGYLVHSV